MEKFGSFFSIIITGVHLPGGFFKGPLLRFWDGRPTRPDNDELRVRLKNQLFFQSGPSSSKIRGVKRKNERGDKKRNTVFSCLMLYFIVFLLL